jgi:formyltetrahydrofolate synthetase
MTVQEASYKLFDWFSTNTYFSLEEDFSQIIDEKIKLKDEKKYKMSILCGLKELEEAGLIKKGPIESENIWILQNKFENLKQSVEIEASTALLMSNVIEGYCKNNNEKFEVVATSIKQADIEMLLKIIFKACAAIDNNPSLN